jgi:hypothetical protein
MAHSREKIIEILKAELPSLAALYGVRKIALFGSCARGEQRKDSDVDLLVDLKKPLGLDFIELADRLEEKLGARVDLATYDMLKRSFKNPRYKRMAENIEKHLVYV